MELEIIEKTKTKALFSLKGTNHTFCNILKKELYNDKDVKAASYAIDHPLLGVPKFIVQTSSAKTPEQALSDAAKRLIKQNEKFATAFKGIKP